MSPRFAVAYRHCSPSALNFDIGSLVVFSSAVSRIGTVRAIAAHRFGAGSFASRQLPYAIGSGFVSTIFWERSMTNAIESEQLTRVGPGTMMGDLMRQYWLPAAKSSEVVAGGDPLRLMLLGER